MSRWLAVVLFSLLLGCKPQPPELATATIRLSVAEMGSSIASTVPDELIRLGFKEQHNPASQPHFRIYSTRIPEEYLVGIPLQPDQSSGEEAIFFSGPKSFNDAGIALYRKLVAGLKARIGEKNVNPNDSSSSGQILIQHKQP